MEIKKIITRDMDQNCYLIQNGSKGILIDPGIDTAKILKETEDIEINYILLTHCHFDHIYSCNYLDKKVVGSKNCDNNLKNQNIVLCNISYEKGCDVILEDGEEMDFEGIRVKCIYTPGHSDCSVCYKIGENLFSGDTIFKGSIGRCDLPTGNMDIIEDSIRNIIYKMDDDTVIYPGHGGSTTVGYEKKYNPYFSE